MRLVTCADLYAPDPDTPLLADALTRVGYAVELCDWRDAAVDWSAARVTVLRSPWDYVDHLPEFLDWAERVSAVSDLWNPAAIVRWNTHKSYAQIHLDALLELGDALVQQFVPAVEHDGEWSVVLVDGEVAHGLRKRPAAGEYLVHEEWGGTTELVDTSASLAELATRVCGVLPAPSLYARVDVVSLAGQWHVMEVEATEPSLWLDLAPETTRRLVLAIGARLSRVRD